MSDSNQSSYRSIFKATSLFGSVQFFQILIQIVKSKFIAILLGPAGVGIIGLYQSGMQLVQNITNMGLASSAVRDVSEAFGLKDYSRINQVITTIRRLVWGTGLLGMIALAVVSPILSKISFGNYDYTIPFIVLSVTLLLDQICAGQKVILQGLRRLTELAKCSVIGSAFGLLVSVPFYYLLGVNGIVPTLILNSVCALVVSWLYSRRIPVQRVEQAPKETLKQGRMMLVMGISMSLSGIFSTVASYIIRAYIQYVNGVEEVGLFQAGFIIMTTYVGLVFNAISTDYYPRLAAVNKDNLKCQEIINQQGEMATLILAPMLSVCLVFMPVILKILYSDDFLKANDYICWASIGMYLRLAAWVISFSFVAKAESKLFMINEALACCYYVVFSIVGYYLGGLRGIGIAFAFQYLVYLIQVYLIARKRYKFRFSDNFIQTYFSLLIALLLCLSIVLYFNGWQKYTFGVLIIIFCSSYCLFLLNKKIDLMGAIRSRIKK